jgi:hypothetical protein
VVYIFFFCRTNISFIFRLEIEFCILISINSNYQTLLKIPFSSIDLHHNIIRPRRKTTAKEKTNNQKEKNQNKQATKRYILVGMVVVMLKIMLVIMVVVVMLFSCHGEILRCELWCSTSNWR